MSELSPFKIYESIRSRLSISDKKVNSQAIENIFSIIDDFDTFLFDAFGVLNVGSKPIDGAVAAIDHLHNMGKTCIVVSNASAYDHEFHIRKFLKMGFHFPDNAIITSRDAVLSGISRYPKNMLWGTIGPDIAHRDLRKMGIQTIDQEDTSFDNSEGFLFFSPTRWDEKKQAAFEAILETRPRPVLLGNPDLIAPQGEHFSIEAGYYVLHRLSDKSFECVDVFGKPFHAIYDIAKTRIASLTGRFDPERTLMVGDTLHTDILGGNAYGIKTALVTSQGFFKGQDFAQAIQESGITPDFTLPKI